MAMAVMRIAFNIVLCFYRTSPRSVKPAGKNTCLPARLAPVFRRIADDPTGDLAMKTCWILILLCSALPAFALRGGMEKATVYAMHKVPCMEAQSSGHGGIFSGLGGGNGGVVNECIEYELRTEKVRYIIRPNRAILLLLGGDVSIKLADSELLLRTGESAKDIRCAVLAMSLRSEVEPREGNRPVRPICHAESGREISCPEEP